MGPLEYIVLLSFILTGAQATNCSFAPDNPENHTILITPDSYPSSGHYAVDEVALFECIGTDGFGFVYRRCLGNEMWSAPNRACRDSLPVDPGCISGIIFGVISLLVTVLSVVASFNIGPAKSDNMADQTANRENNLTYQKAATSEHEMVTWAPKSNADDRLREEPELEKPANGSDVRKLENNSNSVAV